MVADVLAHQVDEVIVELQSAMATMSSAADLRAWCDDTIAYYARSKDPIRCPIGSFVYELGVGDHAARAALKAGFARWEKLLRQGLQRVADNGQLAPQTDPRALAAALLAAYQGGVCRPG